MLSYLFGGSKKSEKPENADPELAMRDGMAEHGEFHSEIDGTLLMEDFLIFRAVILRQALRSFQPLKDKLQIDKLEYFKAQDQTKYVNIFRQGSEFYQRSIILMTNRACEWTEVSMTNYQASINKYMQDEKTRERL